MRGARGGGVINGGGCSCCTGQATKLLKKVVQINAVRNGRVQDGN